MEIGVLGVNHKLADMPLREQLAKSCLEYFSFINVSCSVHAFILLSTCNRTEIYFSSKNLAETHSYILSLLRKSVEGDFEQKLYSFFGPDCFSHLCRVAAGLDSAILGETEIQGQVKLAYELAQQATKLPKPLHYLFQKALMISKKIRSSIPLGISACGIEQAILQAAHRAFINPRKANVLFIGASSINQKLLRFFKEREIGSLTLCNRSCAAAAEFAARYSLKILPWEDLFLWHQFDWIICGTKSPHPLITHASLPQQLHTPKLLIDLGVPRNIDPSIQHSLIKLWNIDQLSSTQQTTHADHFQVFHRADAMVSDAAHLHIDLFRQKEFHLAKKKT